MKFFAIIQSEFLKYARRWEMMPYEFQKGYIERHPGTRRRITAPPTPKSPTSGLRIHEPSKGHAKPILNILRSITNASTDKPVVRNYLTMREGSHNKFHYFAVFPTKNGQFAAANAWGRIGYEPHAMVFGTSSTEKGAINMMDAKMEKKLKKGYRESKMIPEESAQPMLA